ncbi:MAG: heparin lyase I family protein [Fibrobacteres bacterium]|nr:heparin lyase I family protein [Fibrobacterota bacterium]
MRMLPIGLVVLMGACSDTEAPEPPTEAPPWRFHSDFERASTFMDLFPTDLSGWTNVQCVQPDGTQSSAPSGLSVVSGSNRISLDPSLAGLGAKAMKFEAPPTGSSVSKASIAKQGVDFKPGDQVVVKFRLYLEDHGSAENLFLMDLESMELSGYPGRRLAISGSQELILESKNAGGAYGSGPNFKPTSASKVAVPKGQWVSIQVDLVLARDDQGSVKIWQDGLLVVVANGMTFPTEPDITHYDWVEFGQTANSSANAQTLWMDDISITRL